MNISNVRLGFATNSSSSHSIVHIVKKEDLAKIIEDPMDSPSFGWEDFIIKTPEEKMKYFAALICTSLRSDHMPDRVVGLIAEDFIGKKWGIHPDSWYVDHQSAITIPRTKDGKDLNLDFAREFYNFLMQDDIVICGGNDNGDDSGQRKIPKDVKFKKVETLRPLEESYCDFFAKKQGPKHWSLFSQSSGTKLTFSFDDKAGVLKKAYTPDLIDLKITDICNENCAYCYQDSTPHGTHADMGNIEKVLRAIAEMDVFEIALGGGDPTLHPEFLNILETIHYFKIVPNFSTRSLDWLKKPLLKKAVNDYVGAVGISVSSMRQVEDAVHYLEEHRIEPKKIVFHYVLGSISIEEYENILKATRDYGYNVLLLGYKDIGRSAAFKPYPHETWLDIIKKDFSYGGFGIDTLVAKTYKKQLKAADVHERTYYTEEGKFSMYIDAVNLTVGPCSYCPTDKMTKLNDKAWGWEDEIRGAFDTY